MQQKNSLERLFFKIIRLFSKFNAGIYEATVPH